MNKVKKKAYVIHSRERMFDLINSVDEYPKFLKWCTDSHILDQTENHMLAGLTVSLVGIKQKFTTKNTFAFDNNISFINLELVDGPFSHLKGYWQITEYPNQMCKVELVLEFNFKTGLLNATFKSAFSKIAEQLVSDFIERANEIYS